MIFDESVNASSTMDDDDDDGVDCDYNYIDDESYDNSTYGNSSSSSSSSGSSSGSDSDRGNTRYEIDHNHDDDSTASLTTEIEDSFDTGRASHESRTLDEDADEAFQYPKDSAPQGLDIVAKLLSGAKEIFLDASCATGSAKTPAHEVARHISEALAQTTTLQKLSFCGPWRGKSVKSRLVLEILFDGLLDNTSVHTVVLRDNPSFDRYAGYAFGTMLKAHGRLQKLEIVHCRFLGSGWNSLLLGLQHSSSVKKLSVEDCNNLSSDEIDGISSTIQFLHLESLRLCKIQLHKINIENLSFLLRAIQQTKSLKEVDLSRNNLGGVPRAILLLTKCLSGDPVWIGSERNGTDDHLPPKYHHHIEKLVLVDCGISQKSSVKILARALDSTQAKLSAEGNEHPLVLTALDLSKNRFGNGGARILQKLIEANPKITTLGMVGCDTGASHLKTMADRLRYNNSFLQKIGLGSDVSLAILDSVTAVERVFGGRKTTATGTAAVAEGGDDDTETSTGGGCSCVR